jgi:hypothetical protein
METLSMQVFRLVSQQAGLTDRQITNRLKGMNAPQQPINIAARGLAEKGIIERRRRDDGLIGNYAITQQAPANLGNIGLPHAGSAVTPITSDHAPAASAIPRRGRPPAIDKQIYTSPALQEDALKHALKIWLSKNSWETTIAWRNVPGIDILATRNSERWVIEVKGIGSRPEMRVNYFIGILGETLQRMDDPNSKYSIALPDVSQFRRLWERLPHLAKKRTGITALFVNEEGQVTEVS